MNILETLRDFINASIVFIVSWLLWVVKIIFSFMIGPIKFFLKSMGGLSKTVWGVIGIPVSVVLKIISIPFLLFFRVILSLPYLKNILFKLGLVFAWILIKPIVWLWGIVYASVLIPNIYYFTRIFSVQTINELALLTLTQPVIRSLWGKGGHSALFTSWETLTDKVFNARTLDPTSQSSANTDVLTNLFMRKPGEEEIKDDRTSVLFPFFAQWLTDSFMRINPVDRRKNSSNHELDLCQIYGLKEEQTDALRLKLGGRLRARYMKRESSQENPDTRVTILKWDDDSLDQVDLAHRERATNTINNISQPIYEEYLPLLFEKTENSADLYFYEGYKVKDRYKILMDKYITLSGKKSIEGNPKNLAEYMKSLVQFVSDERKMEIDGTVGAMYATGLERGNASVGYTMFSTLFLREHNRICDELINSKFCSQDEDEKLFQTARMINTIVYLKIIIQSYINHIGGTKFTWGFYPDKLSKPDRFNFGRIKQQWFKPNWVSLEFNLLYRWHSLIPDFFQLGDASKQLNYYFHNNGSLESAGLDECYKAASQQYANKICLKNTPFYLRDAVKASLDMSRKFGAAPFMKYYKYFKATRGIKSLNALCGDTLSEKGWAKEIQGAYSANSEGSALEELDFYVGLFAEQKFENKPFGELIFRMVSSDAFTHLYRNPLLSPEIFNQKVLGEVGMTIINSTESLEDILLRNSHGNRVVANFGIA